MSQGTCSTHLRFIWIVLIEKSCVEFTSRVKVYSKFYTIFQCIIVRKISYLPYQIQNMDASSQQLVKIMNANKSTIEVLKWVNKYIYYFFWSINLPCYFCALILHFLCTFLATFLHLLFTSREPFLLHFLLIIWKLNLK